MTWIEIKIVCGLYILKQEQGPEAKQLVSKTNCFRPNSQGMFQTLSTLTMSPISEDIDLFKYWMGVWLIMSHDDSHSADFLMFPLCRNNNLSYLIGKYLRGANDIIKGVIQNNLTVVNKRKNSLKKNVKELEICQQCDKWLSLNKVGCLIQIGWVLHHEKPD